MCVRALIFVWIIHQYRFQVLLFEDKASTGSWLYGSSLGWTILRLKIGLSKQDFLYIFHLQELRMSLWTLAILRTARMFFGLCTHPHRHQYINTISAWPDYFGKMSYSYYHYRR